MIHLNINSFIWIAKSGLFSYTLGHTRIEPPSLWNEINKFVWKMVWTNNVNLLQSLSSSWSLSFLCKCVSSPQQWPCFHPQGRTWSIGINAYLHQHRIYRISVAAKKENHLPIVHVSSEDGTRWVFLRTLLNIAVCVSWSIILLKKRQLYPSDYSKFLSNPATCYIPLQRHQVAVRRPFLIKSFYNLFLILRW